MSFKAFLQIKGLKGESTDEKHTEWSEIVTFNVGARRPFSSGGGTGTTGRREWDDIKITKVVDAASAPLLSYLINNTMVDEVVIEVCEASDTKSAFYRYKLNQVCISSVRIIGNATDVYSRPIEEITLRYNKIEWTYTPLRTAKTGRAEFMGNDLMVGDEEG
ncbi:MAG: type VI secretion system tube protein Hcp [Sedimentisphaerales bacterium]|nr:type VI secretion system tube protein Hcp [Sedimentisphaerales bacterium]